MDPEKTLYSNLVLVGTKSANGRRYPADVLKSAVEEGLYDGAPVFLDHDEKIQALVGQVQRAYWDGETKCVRGDVRLFPSSPFVDVVRYVFSHLGDSFGFSHVVEADVEEGEDTEEVRRIIRVRSVDLVVDPATTKGLHGLQERLSAARQKRLQECRRPCSASPLEEVLLAYLNGEIGLIQTLALLSRVSGITQKESKGGEEMSNKKAQDPKEKEDAKMAPGDGDEKIDLEDEDVAIEQEEEDMDADEEDTGEEVEEQEDEGEEEEEEEEEGEEVEEQEEEEEEEEEGEEEEVEEEEEEDEENEEDEEEDAEVIEEDDDDGKKSSGKKPTACSEKKLGKLKKKLAESRKLLKLLEKMIHKRYLPSAKEFEIIQKSKDPSGVYEILVEARKKRFTGKPKTLAESKSKPQESEWDRMIEEVRRRKGLIR